MSGVEELAQELPRGFADLEDPLRRAAFATVRHIAEGANRDSPRDKAACFTIARGECGECDASLEMCLVLDLGNTARLVELRCLGDRVGALLTGLIRRESRRALS